MIPVTDAISIDEDELGEKFVRASGPGGQHVNTSSSAVELRFDAEGHYVERAPLRGRGSG